MKCLCFARQSRCASHCRTTGKRFEGVWEGNGLRSCVQQALRDKCKDLTKQLALGHSRDGRPSSTGKRPVASPSVPSGHRPSSRSSRPTLPTSARRSVSPVVKPSHSGKPSSRPRPASAVSQRSTRSHRSAGGASISSLYSGNESDSSVDSRRSRASGSSGGSARLKPFDPTAYEVGVRWACAAFVFR
jgi:hypothetical protein